MAFAVSLLSPGGSRIPSSNPLDEDYDSSDSDDTARTSHHQSHNSRAATTRSSGSDFLFPPRASAGRSSASSSLTTTPVPSRSTSPLPHFFSNTSSSCTSDTDSEPASPYLRSRRNPWWREERPRWWTFSRRRRRRDGRMFRTVKKWARHIVRHPCFPRQPITIILTLILLSIFAICLTLLLMYILNPDKEPLPWRAYCSIPSMASPPEASTLYPAHLDTNVSSQSYPPFPPDNLDSLPPAGIFLGVFSVDTAFERRSLIRSTWASHPRSRNGAGDGDGGAGTSRTIVRFVLGQPRGDWERRIKLEMETYNDMVILPVSENMNTGKSHTFFSWASINAWVPPVYTPSSIPAPRLSYSNYTSTAPPLAPHDSLHAWQDANSGRPKPWVRPDFVVKADDDSFVMLAELEARLRLELHQKPKRAHNALPEPVVTFHTRDEPSATNVSVSSIPTEARPVRSRRTMRWSDFEDPLIYWGYLVTNRLNRFMAGELYALSWNIVDWVAKDPSVKALTRGAEDKQTARWMKIHPRASEIRWVSERCWIYDHPRSGTVYGHGFLFPSEVTRVRRDISYPTKTLDSESNIQLPGNLLTTPASWAHSSVSTFGVRYSPPSADLTTEHSIEALVEGSAMSQIHEGNPMTIEGAWNHREGRRTRYEGRRVGGSIVVHFIKQNMWFLETALALLEGDEYTELEQYQLDNAGLYRQPQHSTPSGYQQYDHL